VPASSTCDRERFRHQLALWNRITRLQLALGARRQSRRSSQRSETSSTIMLSHGRGTMGPITSTSCGRSSRRRHVVRRPILIHSILETAEGQ